MRILTEYLHRMHTIHPQHFKEWIIQIGYGKRMRMRSAGNRMVRARKSSGEKHPHFTSYTKGISNLLIWGYFFHSRCRDCKVFTSSRMPCSWWCLFVLSRQSKMQKRGEPASPCLIMHTCPRSVSLPILGSTLIVISKTIKLRQTNVLLRRSSGSGMPALRATLHVSRISS